MDLQLRNYRHDGHHGHRDHEDAHHLIHYEEFPHREMSLHDGDDLVPHTQEGQELAQGNDVLPHDVLQYDDDHYHDVLRELVLYKSLRLPFGHEGNMRVAHIVMALDIRVAYIEAQVCNMWVGRRDHAMVNISHEVVECVRVRDHRVHDLVKRVHKLVKEIRMENLGEHAYQADSYYMDKQELAVKCPRDQFHIED